MLLSPDLCIYIDYDSQNTMIRVVLQPVSWCFDCPRQLRHIHRIPQHVPDVGSHSGACISAGLYTVSQKTSPTFLAVGLTRESIVGFSLC